MPSAEVDINPKAWTKSAKRNSLCSLPFSTVQPGSPVSASLSSSPENFRIAKWRTLPCLPRERLLHYSRTEHGVRHGYAMECSPRRLLLFRRFLDLARAAQNIGFGVIAFVAGVLIDRAWHRIERQLDGPWLGPGGWIFHGGFIQESFIVDAPEPLRDFQVL